MTDPARPLLRAVDLHQEYRGTPIVRGVSLEIGANESLGIVGASGAGKSTLLRMLAGLEAPSSGTVDFAGTRRERQVVFQDAGTTLSPRWTVRQTLAEAWTVRGERPSPGELAEALAAVQLDESLLGRRPHELSGGQRQRVAIARSLVGGPRLLLLDEPLSALDVSIAAQILELLMHLLRTRALAMVVVAHDLRAVRYLAERVAVMADGRIEEMGPVAELFECPQSAAARALIDALPPLSPSLRKQTAPRVVQGTGSAPKSDSG